MDVSDCKHGHSSSWADLYVPPLLAATALAYLAAGRFVVPIAPGCKASSVVDPRTGRSTLIRWAQCQEEPATPAAVRRWFTGPQLMGLGIVAGPVSGVTLPDGRRAGLEFLDFDDADVHARFVALLAARGVRFLLEGLPCEETLRGGRHYGYCRVEWGTSTTLARRPVGTPPDGRAQMVTLIESKGQGGQCVVAPIPVGIHPAHPARGYTMVRGDWTRMPLITPATRRVLWACAHALDEAPPPHADHSPLVLSVHQRRRGTRIFPPAPITPHRGCRGQEPPIDAVCIRTASIDSHQGPGECVSTQPGRWYALGRRSCGRSYAHGWAVTAR